MSDDPANADPSAPVEIAPGDRLNAGAGDTGPGHAPPVEVTGERVGDSDRSGLIALFSIGVALSIVVHAAFLGAGLLHLPLNASPDEEALPVTVVPDQAQPETQAKPPSPQTAPETPPAPELKEEPKPAPQTPAQKTPAPKEEPKPPAPETQQEKPASPAKPSPQAQTPAPNSRTSDSPASAPPLPAVPSPSAGPGEGVVADKLAQDVAAELRAAIKRCWTIPPGWTSPHQVTVVMNVRLDRKGALAAHPVLLEFSASELGMAAARNALAAVARCAPYKLPPEKFSQWQETQVRLTPD